MAQNGGSFAGMDGSIDSYKRDPNAQGKTPPQGVVYFWDNYFKNNTGRTWVNRNEQLSRFHNAIQGFKARGWSVPDVPDDYILSLISGKDY